MAASGLGPIHGALMAVLLIGEFIGIDRFIQLESLARCSPRLANRNQVCHVRGERVASVSSVLTGVYEKESATGVPASFVGSASHSINVSEESKMIQTNN